MEGDGVVSGGGGSGLIDGVTSEELVDESTVRCPTGPFPVSPVPVLTGEVAHRYRF